MKRCIVVAAAAALFASVFVTVMTAEGRSSRGGQIEITATILSDIAIEQGRPGRVSNSVDQVWRLNDRLGNPIGRLLVWCQWVREPWRLCTGEAILPLGKITWAGETTPPLVGLVAVTGGTGRYFSNNGSLRFTGVAPRKIVLSFRLVSWERG